MNDEVEYNDGPPEPEYETDDSHGVVVFAYLVCVSMFIRNLAALHDDLFLFLT